MKTVEEALGIGEQESFGYDFGLSRRSFTKLLGGGLMLAVGLNGKAVAQETGQRSRGGFLGTGAKNLAARIHLGTDGSITVMAGKVEGGQGARAELTQAAAEELRVPASQVQMILADTELVPDDGMTAGSGTTPRTVPAVRRGAAAARSLLIGLACSQWEVEPAALEVRDGRVVHGASRRVLSYADLAKSADVAKEFEQAIPPGVELTPVKEWRVMGTPVLRPNAREIVTGTRQFPSDVTRPGMMYGKILRPPSYGAKLVAIDTTRAKAMKDVIVVQDDQFVGVVARNSSAALDALAALGSAAKWEVAPGVQPSSKDLAGYLKQNAEGGAPVNPFAGELAGAKAVRRTYYVPYIQHAPLEPRAAVAEWSDGKLTVWTGSQNPFGVKNELMRAFHLPDESVRVVIPDFGGAFGGKHTGECAVEAARLAKAAGKPVSLRWSREEEFTWAYFRPAAVIEAEASLDAKRKIATWFFANINSGPNAVETPYAVGKKECRFVASKPPLRHGSYRGLAATANNFAREVFMDELAAQAGVDPLEFRMAHLHPTDEDSSVGTQTARLQAVLEKAAKEFHWAERAKQKSADVGVGLACGVEKGSYVAACAEVEIDRATGKIKVNRICEAYECGAIVNPANLLSQVQGAVVMGLGAALREEVRFENGKILNDSFAKYLVPRYDDVPEMEIYLIDRPDLSSAGAGETPIIAIAPAIANAVFRATGKSVQGLPVKVA